MSKPKQKQYKKNLRRRNIVITAQTEWHLHRLCAICGYSSNDIGKVIDKLVRAHCAAERGGHNGNG